MSGVKLGGEKKKYLIEMIVIFSTITVTNTCVGYFGSFEGKIKNSVLSPLRS